MARKMKQEKRELTRKVALIGFRGMENPVLPASSRLCSRLIFFLSMKRLKKQPGKELTTL